MKTVLVALLLAVGCAHAPKPCTLSATFPEARYENKWPPEIIASMVQECFLETKSQAHCACYVWAVTDNWTFGQLNMAVAAGKSDKVEAAMKELWVKCDAWVEEQRKRLCP